MPGISAVIITKNEAQNIGRCLASLQGVVDEIVVADSGSSDETVDICRSYGAKVIQVEWKGFAQTKNEANGQATQAYILWLDADEELSPELRESLLRAKKNLTGAYTFNRLNNYCGRWIRHGGYYPDRKVRLFPKEGVAWQGEVHETLHFQREIPVSHLSGDLLHFSYYSAAEHVARLGNYARLAAERYAAQGKKGLGLRMWVSPWARFWNSWLLKGGFLDGTEGLLLTTLTSWEVFLKYAWARKLKKASRNKKT